MRITRAKLNTLLRSGLNPAIKTRKQLAAHLGLDPTSITRWFANRDRLGNPRYSVVPDRHVASILQIFHIAPTCLEMSDEAFRHYCFELALQHTEQVSPRKLVLPRRVPRRNWKTVFALISVLVALAPFWILLDNNRHQDPHPSLPSETVCWSGYPPSLGNFEQVDPADPCDYQKLFHRALLQLYVNSKNRQDAQTEWLIDALQFLSSELDRRRNREKTQLNLEAGRNTLYHADYAAALSHFRSAEHFLTLTADKQSDIARDIAIYTALALYADKPWQTARVAYEHALLENAAQANRLSQAGRQQRQAALTAWAVGNLPQARTLIAIAAASDEKNLGDQHFLIASNRLLAARMLAQLGDLPAAQQHAQQAIDLDTRLFGDLHPRTVQDHIVFTLLKLQAGEFVAARQSYLPVARFFQTYIPAKHTAMQMHTEIQQGLNLLIQASAIENTQLRQQQQNQAWHILQTAFTHTNAFVPPQAKHFFPEEKDI